MRVAVVFSGLMMAIVWPRWSKLFQPLFDVCDESALKIVDVNRGGDVHRRNEAEAIADAASRNNFFKLRSDQDDLAPFFRVKEEIFRMCLCCS